MELISDILLVAGAVGAGFYCIVLARRLNRFTNLDQGVGGAIAVLSAQVDDMTKALASAQGTANGSTESLAVLTERAEDVARRLELLVASMHDLPDSGTLTEQSKPATARDPTDQEGAAPSANPIEFVRRSNDSGAESLFRTQRAWAREAAE